MQLGKGHAHWKSEVLKGQAEQKGRLQPALDTGEGTNTLGS